MPSGDTQPNPAAAGSPPTDMEQLLASVAAEEAASAAAAAAAAPKPPAGTEDSFEADPRNHRLLSPRELHKLRAHQEGFVKALAGRLSLYLRMTCLMKLEGILTVQFQDLQDKWADQCHLTMFKLEPLRGVGVLAVPSTLGLGIVDRLMGGAGAVPEESREMSEIERALLEQAVQVVLNEWCAHWAKQKEVRPAMLGYETNGHFLQIAHPEAIMLLVCTELQIGDATSKVGIAMPYSSLEPLIRQVAQNTRPAAENTPPANPATLRWNACLNEARMPITAEWEGIELRAGDIINLKPGDVLPLDPALVQNVTVRLGDLHKFTARPGNIAGQRAIELTAHVKK